MITPPDPNLLASDDDRSSVVDMLRKGMSDGRLTVSDFDERMAQLYVVRTVGELSQLVAGLPVLQTPAVRVPQGTPFVYVGNVRRMIWYYVLMVAAALVFIVMMFVTEEWWTAIPFTLGCLYRHYCMIADDERNALHTTT